MITKYIGIIVLALAVTIWTFTAGSVFQVSLIINIALVLGLVFVLASGYWYLFWAICLGVLFDFFTGAPNLFFIFGFLIIFSILRYIGSLFSHENISKFLILSILGVLVYHLVFMLISFTFSKFNMLQFHFASSDIINLKILIEVAVTFALVTSIQFITATNKTFKNQVIN